MRILKVLLIIFIFTVFSFGQSAAKFRLEMTSPGGAILFASFSGDGEKVLLVGKESTEVWSAKTGKLLFKFPEKIPLTDAAAIEWQPKGAKFLVYDSSQAGFIFNRKSPALLYDAETGKRIAVLEGKKKNIRGAGWSKDGNRLLTFSKKVSEWDEREISVWTENGEFVNSLYSQRIERLQFIDGGKKLIFDQGFYLKEKPIVIWDVASGKALKSFDQTYQKKDAWNVASLAGISPDEKLLCGYHGISAGLICWETDGDESIKLAFADTKETGDHYYCGFSSDGKTLAVLKSKQHRIEFINSATGKTESFIENKEIEGCARADVYLERSSWSANDRFFLTHDGDDKLTFWEVATGKPTGTFKLIEKHRIPGGYVDYDVLSFHPNKPVLMSASNKLIRLWNIETGELIKSFGKDEIGDSLRQKSFADWSPDGDLLLTGAPNESAVLIWEIKN